MTPVNWLRKALRFWPWLAAISTGLLCAACFPPFDQSWLCWIALTPLIAAVWFSGQNAKRRWIRNLLLGYVAGIVFFTTTFSWFGSLGVLYENFWLRGLSLLLSLYLGVHFAFWSWFVGLIAARDFLISHRNLRIAFLGASAWVTHEWVRGWLFSGFGWNGLGVALHGTWPLIQIAEFTGVTGLSFVVVFGNVIALTTPIRLYFEARTREMRPHFDFTLTLAGMVGLCAFGLYSVQNRQGAKPLRVAAVQADIPQQEKFDPQFSAQIFARFSRLSDLALRSSPPPDVLIWPESSMPDPVHDPNTESNQFLTEFSASSKTDLLLGTLDVEDRHDYNAAVLISGGTHQMQIYRKVHLVPFGEYIPLKRLLFFAESFTKEVGNFAPGTEYTISPVDGHRISTAICYESIFPDLMRRFVKQGSELFVLITNDGWFGESSAPFQHLRMGVVRAVENRRYMVRDANTGISAIIDPYGRIESSTRIGMRTILDGTAHFRSDLTFYTRYGDVFAYANALAAVIAIAIAAKENHHARRTHRKIRST
jgi:apolipoprotein N-acyltransferase